MKGREITERNLIIQERARRGESLEDLAKEYGLARDTIYVITSQRKHRPLQGADDLDPFVKGARKRRRRERGS